MSFITYMRYKQSAAGLFESTSEDILRLTEDPLRYEVNSTSMSRRSRHRRFSLDQRIPTLPASPEIFQVLQRDLRNLL